MISLPLPATRGKGRAHRVFHPLAGADLRVLARLFATGGGVPLDRLHVPLLAMVSALSRLPFTVTEALASRILPDAADLPAPIFVVGYWRSGTTHFSNVLSRWPSLGILPPICVGMPQEALGLGRLVRPFIEQFYPKTRLIDAVPLAAGLPQEDELAIANLSVWSFYHGIYFPKRSDDWIERGLFFKGATPADIETWRRMLRNYLTKMTLHQGRRPLLVRNPAHGARIDLLRSIWPDAKFVHVYRNPFVVYASAVRMFSTLFRELAVQHDEVDVDEMVLETYPRLMSAMSAGLERVPDGNVSHVRFEDFERRPMEELQRVFADLSFNDYPNAAPRFARYLGNIGPYRKTAHTFDQGSLAEVATRWRPFVERWRYEVPATAKAA